MKRKLFALTIIFALIFSLQADVFANERAVIASNGDIYCRDYTEDGYEDRVIGNLAELRILCGNGEETDPDAKAEDTEPTPTSADVPADREPSDNKLATPTTRPTAEHFPDADSEGLPAEIVDSAKDPVKEERLQADAVQIDERLNVSAEPSDTEIEKPAAEKPEYGKPEAVKFEGEKLEHEKPEEVKSEDGKPEEVKSEDGKPEEMKPEDEKLEEVKSEGEKPEEVKSEDGKPEEVKSEGEKPEEVKPEDGKPEEVKSEDEKPEDEKPEEGESAAKDGEHRNKRPGIFLAAGAAVVLLAVLAVWILKRKNDDRRKIQRTYQPDIPVDADSIIISYLSGGKKGCIDVLPYKERYIIGTAPDCDLVIEGMNIAERHAKISENNGRFYMEDLDTDDGTYLNGMRLYSANRLRKDSVITIGSISFVISF